MGVKRVKPGRAKQSFAKLRTKTLSSHNKRCCRDFVTLGNRRVECVALEPVTFNLEVVALSN